MSMSDLQTVETTAKLMLKREGRQSFYRKGDSAQEFIRVTSFDDPREHGAPVLTLIKSSLLLLPAAM